MKNNKLVLDISNVVASPVLSGEDDSHVWTGVVRSDRINQYIIPDDKKREEFLKLVKKFETDIIEYRTKFRASRNLLFKMQLDGFFDKDADNLENRILDTGRKIKEVLNDKNSGIDMELFWIQLCRDYEEILKENPREFTHMNPNAKKNLELFKKTFDERELSAREIYIPDENKFVCKVFATKSQEKHFTNGDKNKDILLKALEAITGKKDISSKEKSEIVKELATGVTLADLQDIFIGTGLAGLEYLTVFKNYLLKTGMKPEEIAKLDIEEIKDRALESYNEKGIDMHSNLITQCVIDGIKYIDIEKFLLVAMVRPLEGYKRLASTGSRSQEASELSKKEEAKNAGIDADAYIVQEETFETIVKKMKRTEEINRKILNANLINRRTKTRIVVDDNYQEVTLKYLQDLMKNYCDGMYLTDIIKENLVYSAFENEDNMDFWSDELTTRIGFSDGDILILSFSSFKNFEHLYKAGLLDKKDIEIMVMQAKYDNLEEVITSTIGDRPEKIKDILNNADMLLKRLYDNKYINADDIKDYFDKKIITIEDIDKIREGKSEEEQIEFDSQIGEKFDINDILEKYKNYIEEYVNFINAQNDPNKTPKEIEVLKNRSDELRDEKNTYLEVFKKYNSQALNKDEILDTYYFDMQVENEDILKESIKSMYEDGIISLENIISLDKSYIIPMLDKLSLEDANKIRKSMQFSELEDLLDNIFSDSQFTDERKFIIVMNLLGEDTDEDRNAREFYLSLLDFNDSEKRVTGNGKRKKVDNRRTASNKYIYPDFIKWKFYKGLDKDVRVTRYSNGYVEFASNKLGSRIIEKYYDGDKPAYGTATYILPEQEFRRHQSDLITITPTGNILEGGILRQIIPMKDRIAHRTQSAKKTWMDEIVRYFDIDFDREKDSRYTKEELDELKLTIEKHKTDYEEVK